MILRPARALFVLAICLAALAAVARAAPGAPSTGCTLLIHVTGFRNNNGALGAILFSSPAGWPEDLDKAYRHAHFPIDGNHATARFDHVPPGSYGVAVLHDENQNRKLDRNIFLFPKEGFGFANNPEVLLTPPPMQKATVTVICPETATDIRLIYK